MSRKTIAVLALPMALAACATATPSDGGIQPGEHPGSGNDVTIAPAPDTALGRAAKELEGLTRGKMVYSPAFLATNPYAAGSFDHLRNLLYIDTATYQNPSKESAVVRHELVHARVFGELQRRAHAPWYGSLSGGSFAPNALNLDEQLAYRYDLVQAAKELRMNFMLSSSTEFDKDTLKKIREQVARRFAGSPPQKGVVLSEYVQAVDGVAKKLLHGEWHSKPAAVALATLVREKSLCKDGKYVETSGVTTVELRSKYEGKPFLARIPLPSSGGLADMRNCPLLQEQVADAEKFSRESATFFEKSRADFERVLRLPDAEVKGHLEDFCAQIEASPLPVAGTSLRRTIPSHTSSQGKIVLRKHAAPVVMLSPDLFVLLASLRATVAAENGVGIAAPQVGIGQRVILVKRMDRAPEKPFVAYINPEILERSAETDVDWEGCLSIPEGMGQVRRARSIRVRALNEMGEPVEEQLEGYVARIFQHETDHLDGVLFIDRKEPGDLVSKEVVRRLRQGSAK